MIVHGTTPEILCEVIDIRLSRELDTPYSTLAQIVFSCRHGTIDVFKFDLKPDSKVRVGYMAWMEISKETLLFFLRHGNKGFNYCEWKEGNILLILDVLFSPRHPTMARAHMLEKIRKYRVVTFSRRGKIKVYRRNGKKFHKCYEVADRAAR
jgi:hypothetical protein